MLELLEMVMTKIVKSIGGTALKIGLPIPLIDNVTISDDAQIVTKKKIGIIGSYETYGRNDWDGKGKNLSEDIIH
uniref:Uncharacterized protein n=1 Tax=Elaeophora elaphi TaxID=1147741 RepID=A0A0R3RP45_9BILA